MDIQLNLSAFHRKAAQLEGAIDQVPFALANALTSAAFKTRETLVSETWPGAVKARNRNFIRASLRIERATKNNLNVAIYDHLDRGNLKLHAEGGTRTPQRNRLAIPVTGAVRRTSKGVQASQRPRAIIDATPKRALRITPKGIFVGRNGRLRLVYVFRQSAQIHKSVPFYEDFNRVMAEEIGAAFAASMARAMKTRRR